MFSQGAAIDWEMFDTHHEDFIKEVVIYNPPPELEKFITYFLCENELPLESFKTVLDKDALTVYVRYQWVAVEVVGAILEYEHIV